MTKLLATIIFISLTSSCFGQDTKTTYYKNLWLDKEVAKEKAEFSQTILTNQDGSVTTIVKNIKKNVIIKSETFQGEEPTGIWIYRKGNDSTLLDYNFKLNYSDENCTDTLANTIRDYLVDNDSLGYKAPKILNGEITIKQYFTLNLNYLQAARDQELQGNVVVAFTINKDGTTSNFHIIKGAHILLDKEAVRALRQLKFSHPIIYKGQAKSVCLVMPITFTLGN